MIGRQERIMVFGSLLREHGPEVLRRSRERTKSAPNICSRIIQTGCHLESGNFELR